MDGKYPFFPCSATTQVARGVMGILKVGGNLSFLLASSGCLARGLPVPSIFGKGGPQGRTMVPIFRSLFGEVSETVYLFEYHGNRAY